MGRKGKKLQTKDDRISDLPDSIIQYILSFLPSTKQVIQTSVLSKRWQKQWTGVPVLIFDFSGMRSLLSDEQITRMSSRISRFIDNVLIHHVCSKIKKFHIILDWKTFIADTNYDSKLRFAIKKEVEELTLNLGCVGKFELPNFFFNYASLVRLQLVNCTLAPEGGFNWKNLKDLNLEFCSLRNQAIENVVSGSPLLESLVINNCHGFNRLDIASKSLKRLDLLNLSEEFVLEISCPNLEELYAIKSVGPFTKLSDKAIANVLSTSPLLEVLELNRCEGFKQLFIDSNSLKKLVLAGIVSDGIAISCPSLEELNLKLLYIKSKTIKLMNLPSLICATLDFDPLVSWHCKIAWRCFIDLVRMILEQLHHVKELKFEGDFIKVLSGMEMEGESCPSLEVKCLTLNGGTYFLKSIPGMAYALCSSPELEKLVITFPLDEHRNADTFMLHFSGENYWNSKGTMFNCLVSYLKIIKIIGLSEKYGTLELVLDFIEFVMRNARVLEKMVVILEDSRADFVSKLSQQLSSFPRFSQHVCFELLCSKQLGMSKYARDTPKF